MAASEKTYRIGKIASLLDVKTSVLRFWEQEFPVLSPKRVNGQRIYGETDLHLLRHIRALLYDKGMTIDGARQQLKKHALSILGQEEFDARMQALATRKKAQNDRRRARALQHRETPRTGSPPDTNGSTGDRAFLSDILKELQTLRQEIERL